MASGAVHHVVTPSGAIAVVGNDRIRIFDPDISTTGPADFRLLPGVDRVAAVEIGGMSFLVVARRVPVSGGVEHRLGLIRLNTTLTAITMILVDEIVVANATADLALGYMTGAANPQLAVAHSGGVAVHQVAATQLGGLFMNLTFEGGAVAVDVGPVGPGTTDDIVAVGPDTDNSGRIHVFEGINGNFVRSDDLAFNKAILPVDVALGRANDDELEDLLIADQLGDQLVVIPVQPPPCAVFIPAFMHGHVGEAIYNSAERQEDIDNMAAASVVEMNAINAVRRPPGAFRNRIAHVAPALCPFQTIPVAGHWERRVADGTFVFLASRAVWLGSALVPIPVCRELVWPFIPLPSLEPVTYWLGVAWLILPKASIALECTLDPLPGDAFTRTRYIAGGLGWGLELIGSSMSGQASRTAAVDVANVMQEAIDLADQRMDSCDGQIYIDMVGYSRGGAVTSSALARTQNQRTSYNTLATVTYVDAIDPTPADQLRPWARAGYFIRDPFVTRVANEGISSFRAQIAEGFPPLDLLEPVFDPVGEDPDFILSDIIGLPLGHDRTADLFVGPLTVGEDGPFALVTHPFRPVPHSSMHRGDPGPDGIFGNTDDLPYGFFQVENFVEQLALPFTAPSFTFAATSTLGRYSTGPFGEPRLDVLNGVGFSGQNPARDFLAEDANRPVACGGLGQPATPPAENGQAATRSKATRTNYAEDPSFRASAGVVQNASDLVDHDTDLKDALPGDADFDWVRDLINEIATTRMIPGGVWQKIQGSPQLVPGGLTATEALREAVADPNIDYNALDTQAEAQAAHDAFEDELGALPLSERDDRLNYLQRVAGLGVGEDEPYLAFPSTTSGVRQELHLGSIEHEVLHVRIMARLHHAQSTLSMVFKGPGLSGGQSVSGNQGLVEIKFDLVRDGSNDYLRDFVELSGKYVEIYQVTVQPHLPVYNPDTGKAYELVMVEDGVDWTTASTQAQRMVYDGKMGDLVTITSEEEQTFLKATFAADLPAWVNARGTDIPASLEWVNKQPIKTELWAAGVSFTADRRRGSYVYAETAAEGLGLNHASPIASRGELPMGFYVEYNFGGSSLLAGEGSALSQSADDMCLVEDEATPCTEPSDSVAPAPVRPTLELPPIVGITEEEPAANP